MQYELMIQPVLWAVSGGVCAAYLVRALWVGHKDEPVRHHVFVAVASVIVALAIVPAIGVVPPGSRGVVYSADGGIQLAERGEGFTIVVPWAQKLRIMSVRTQKVYSAKIFSQSRDLQEITVVASVNFHVDPAKAADLYRNVGPAYQDTVVQPALYQRLKAGVGQINAVDFAVQRDALARTVERQLTDQLGQYGIIVEYVNIEDAIFAKQFVSAVQDKVIAIQKAAEQRRLVEVQAAIKRQTIIRAEARARSVLIEAQAQAKANLLLARSLSSPLLQWRWITTWNGVLPTTLLNGGRAALLLNGSGAGTSGYGYLGP